MINSALKEQPLAPKERAPRAVNFVVDSTKDSDEYHRKSIATRIVRVPADSDKPHQENDGKSVATPYQMSVEDEVEKREKCGFDRILVTNIFNLIIGTCALAMYVVAQQKDREWTINLSKEKLNMLTDEAANKFENSTTRKKKIEKISDLADRNQDPPLAAIALFGFIDIVVLIHIIVYFFNNISSYRVFFGRLLNVFAALVYCTILVIIVDSTLRINEAYDHLYTIYHKASAKNKNARLFPLFYHCILHHNMNAHEEPTDQINKEGICQDTDLKIATMALCGFNIILHGAVAVVTKSKLMMLRDKLDEAPDLLYDTYDTRNIRIRLNYDDENRAYAERVDVDNRRISDAASPKEEKRRRSLRFGSVTFELTPSGQIRDVSAPTPTIMPEFEPVDLKIQRLAVRLNSIDSGSGISVDEPQAQGPIGPRKNTAGSLERITEPAKK